jgi:hypothetical protein
MRRIRSTHLITAIVFISVLAEVSYYALSGWAFESHINVAYLLIFLNTAIAVAGLWTLHRARWIAYLVISAALTILVGAVTPLSTLGILARILAPN